MDELIYLLQGTFAKNTEGYNRFTETDRTAVYAECSDPVRSQRDLAQKLGYVATLRIKLHKSEFHNQRYVEFHNRKFEVKESFTVNDELVELTCSDMRA